MSTNQTFQEIKKSLIEFHAHEGLSAFEELMETRTSPTPELAFRLLEHTAKLYRYTGDEAVLKAVMGLRQEKKRVLITMAVQAIVVEDLIAKLTQLAKEEDLDEDDLTAIELALLRRDDFGLVLYLAERVSFPLITKKFEQELAHALGSAQGRLERLDQAFGKMPEATLVCRSVLDGIRQAAVKELPPQAWWLQDPGPELERGDNSLLQLLITKKN